MTINLWLDGALCWVRSLVSLCSVSLSNILIISQCKLQYTLPYTHTLTHKISLVKEKQKRKIGFVVSTISEPNLFLWNTFRIILICSKFSASQRLYRRHKNHKWLNKEVYWSKRKLVKIFVIRGLKEEHTVSRWLWQKHFPSKAKLE